MKKESLKETNINECKIKVIEASSREELETKLNKIENIVDLQFSTFSHGGNVTWSALVFIKK